ncbi:MAG: tRNA (adenosine(37)-N6)-threonylcarbamoyltransferase complex ATPase subunit type 1 TsaE, partial [Brooklawnia sp.]
DALGDDLAAIQRRIVEQIGVIAFDDGYPVGCLFLSLDHAAEPPTGSLHRVSVLPSQRLNGVAAMMVRSAADLAIQAGMRRLQLVARRELPQVVKWWGSHGFEFDHDLDEYRMVLVVPLPARAVIPTAARMQGLGRRLARLLRAGDLVVLNGELGAGKTTLAQGIGAGLQVGGAVTSPTFVLSRIHPALGEGPQLVHVDAYRLSSAAELADLDLDDSLAESVTLVEWGQGLAEQFSADRLEITIERGGDGDGETREVTLHGIGARWREVDLWKLVDQGKEN